ncbi:hypothetical protein RB11759 [Rhodopirellula baltica SH 1]|uniref:Uncharacterized protein n=1 Tax=Rhodopirellula baltica (strain DSM 10527 / NCIMB 13988 / SH1) TaxID=243090 RepID=Q7UDV5_RHOBA|nr:hypothetical protein RB11759 [Rhodopirellula baltica SH 1]
MRLRGMLRWPCRCGGLRWADLQGSEVSSLRHLGEICAVCGKRNVVGRDRGLLDASLLVKHRLGVM